MNQADSRSKSRKVPALRLLSSCLCVGGPKEHRDFVVDAAAKCAFCEADMRRAHALLNPERAVCRDARVSERDLANATRDCGIICIGLPHGRRASAYVQSAVHTCIRIET